MGTARFLGPLHRQFLEISGLERLQSLAINPELEASEGMDRIWIELLICPFLSQKYNNFRGLAHTISTH